MKKGFTQFENCIFSVQISLYEWIKQNVRGNTQWYVMRVVCQNT